jgi:hypothetical protein
MVGWLVAGLRYPLRAPKTSSSSSSSSNRLSNGSSNGISSSNGGAAAEPAVASSTSRICRAEAEEPTGQLPFRVCAILAQLRAAHPQVLFRSVSRREVEVPVVGLLLRLIRAEAGPLTDMYAYRDAHSGHKASEGGRGRGSGDGALSLANVTLPEEGAGNPLGSHNFVSVPRPAAPLEDFGYSLGPAPGRAGDPPPAAAAVTVTHPPSRALLTALRACLVLCKDMNLRPIWFGERWSFHWSFADRYLCSRDFALLMFLLWHHYRHARGAGGAVKGLCTGILVAVADKVSRHPVSNKVVRRPGRAAARGGVCASAAADVSRESGDTLDEHNAAPAPAPAPAPAGGQRRRSWSRSRSFSGGAEAALGEAPLDGDGDSAAVVPPHRMLPLLAISLAQFTGGAAKTAASAAKARALSEHAPVDSRKVSTEHPSKLSAHAHAHAPAPAQRVSSGSPRAGGRGKSLSGGHPQGPGGGAGGGQEGGAEEYAVSSEAVQYTLEGLELFLCRRPEAPHTEHTHADTDHTDTDQGALSEYAHYFGGSASTSTSTAAAAAAAATPLCASVLFLMDQYPAVHGIQRAGLSLLLFLCRADARNVDILGESCRCIISAVISFPTDQSVHHTFCTLVLMLAQRSDANRNALLFHAIYKWLFISIKYGWEDVTPIACRAVAAVADTPARAAMVGGGGSRLCDVLVAALGDPQHRASAALQTDGLRAVLALAQSPACVQKMRASGGKRTLMDTRRYLARLLSDTHTDALPAGYARADLAALLTATHDFPGLFDKDKCTIS